MHAQGHLLTLREGAQAKAVIAPELGAWLLRYARHFAGHGYVEGLHFSQEVLERYPNQMYAGNPLLFPMVSFNHLPGAENTYEWAGKKHPLPQHGFARKSKWKVVEAQENRVTMELRDCSATRAVYPFEFRCAVKYELRGEALCLSQTVENRGADVMPFSTGIHPYFPVPITASGSRENCVVQLPRASRIIPAADWSSWREEPIASRELPVNEDVSGTLFLTALETPEIRLADRRAGFQIILNFAEAPRHRYVALWSKSTREPFYCIEPWTALPNSFSRGTELIRLEPGERFEARFWMKIERI